MMNRLFAIVLVPSDGSEESIAAGRLAFRIARQQGSRVILLHVMELQAELHGARFSGETKIQVRARMQREATGCLDQLEEIAAQFEVSVEREVREGDPHKMIVWRAKELGVDLIVMGHAGRRGPRRKIMGSVAERVIRFAACPVLIVKE
jgi:nucleotide-binding universal stress UspA family protein